MFKYSVLVTNIAGFSSLIGLKLRDRLLADDDVTVLTPSLMLPMWW